MSSSVCKNCGSSDIDQDSARGDVVCMGCGSVLETQIIVSEVQFSESSGGRSNPVGQFVGIEGNLGVSRQITLQNGRNRIQNLAARLNIPGSVVDVAHRLFKMAVSRGLTKGRKSNHMSAACLFLACRMNDNPFLLLDFSDALETDVYTLGRIYLQLCKELSQKIPVLDPCIYLHRYAHKLEFGEKTYEVINTANRLVQRMKRDWMVQGRRPSGLCGAALLVAARIFDFNRTIKDIMKVVRIGENTIKKRLNEFEQTPSSQLTIDEFYKIDLEEEMDPPSFSENKRKAKLAQLEEQGDLPYLTDEVEKLQTEIENAIQEENTKKHRRYKKYLSVCTSATDSDSGSTCSTAPSLSDLDEELAQYSDLLDDSTLLSRIESDVEDESFTESKIIIVRKCESRSGEVEEELKELCSVDVDSILMPPPSLIVSGPKPTAASLGLKESIRECMKETKCSTDSKDIELDLTGIDDKELEDLILGEDEVKIKTAIWMRENADFLKEQKEKEEKKAKELADNPEVKKKRKPRKRQPKTEASSAGEAVQKILLEKKMSNKINYDVLMGLNKVAAANETSPAIADNSLKRVGDDKIIDTNAVLKKLKMEDKQPKKRSYDETVVVLDDLDAQPEVTAEDNTEAHDDGEHHDADIDYISYSKCNMFDAGDLEPVDEYNDS